jgi:UDP-N-acetylglucosamine--N-acetylmuramyl-(pentapeptide) pyrophosphoryl-undecaprenol N-acetylglucosamine transferase
MKWNGEIMKKIVLTGGGTAGHVMPNLALLPYLHAEGYDVHYIGSKQGIEKTLCEQAGIPYHVISTGKLRRYRSLRNLTDPFRVIGGFFGSFRILGKLKPLLIFSKGGFVSVPVAAAGKLRGIPVVLHESDLTPGLANKLCMPFSAAVCASFPETMPHLNPKKRKLTGLPIRDELLNGSREKGLSLSGFTGEKPVLSVIGGSLGAVAINQVVREAIDELGAQFDIIHICGTGNVDPTIEKDFYKQFEFVGDELADLFACTDIVISRAGANVIFELLALRKPALLIPLTKSSSRGDQIQNARNFASNGYSMLLLQEELDCTTLLSSCHQLFEQRQVLIDAMQESAVSNGTQNVLNVVYSCVKDKKSS